MADNITILAQARVNWMATLDEEAKAKIAAYREASRANSEEQK